MIGWIIFAIVVVCVLLYCKFGKSIGHIPDFRKPFSLFALIVYAIIMLVCCSCRSVQYVPVETTRTEIQYKERADSTVIKEKVNVRDSIRMRDSIVQIVNDKGDVIRTEIWHWKEKYSDVNTQYDLLKSQYDSLYLAKHDSVQMPCPVYIEKRLTLWGNIKQSVGGVALLFIIGFVIGWLVYRIRRKEV